MKDVASSQYGGQTANRADEHFAEYAKKDYDKFLEQAHEIMPDDLPIEIAERQVRMAKAVEPKRLHFEKDRPALPMDEPFNKDASRLQQLREVWAKIQTRKAIYDAMQTMEYQINSNRVSNGQTPFVTVGFGARHRLVRARNPARHLPQPHPRPWFRASHRHLPEARLHHQARCERRSGRPELRPEAVGPRMRHQAHVPGRHLLREHREDHRLLKAPMGCRSFLQGWIDPKTGRMSRTAA